MGIKLVCCYGKWTFRIYNGFYGEYETEQEAENHRTEAQAEHNARLEGSRELARKSNEFYINL